MPHRPETLGRGTIIVAAAKRSFAIMAADRLIVRHNVQGQRIANGNGTKIVGHPILPLAVGVAGFAELNGQATTEYVLGAVRDIEPPRLTLAHVADRLRQRLASTVEILREWPDPTTAPQLKLVFYIALIQRGIPEVGRLTLWPPIGFPKDYEYGDPAFYGIPEPLGGPGYAETRHGSKAQFVGEHTRSARGMIVHLRDVLNLAMADEAARVEPENRWIGEGTNIFVVKPRGVQMV